MGKISQSILCGASAPHRLMSQSTACLMTGGHFVFGGFMGMEPSCQYPGHTEPLEPSCLQKQGQKLFIKEM